MDNNARAHTAGYLYKKKRKPFQTSSSVGGVGRTADCKGRLPSQRLVHNCLRALPEEEPRCAAPVTRSRSRYWWAAGASSHSGRRWAVVVCWDVTQGFLKLASVRISYSWTEPARWQARVLISR